MEKRNGEDTADQLPSTMPDRHHVRSSAFFEFQCPFNTRELLKFVLLAPLLPIRLAIFLLLLLPSAALSELVCIGWPIGTEPLPAWRVRLLSCTAWLTRLQLLMLGLVVEVKGWRHYEEARARGVRLLVFNHPSWVDALLLYHLFRPASVASEADVQLPVVGSIMKATQSILLSRHQMVRAPRGQPSAGGATQQVQARVKDRRWPMLAIAPEGVVHSGRCVIEFKTGAFVPGVPVLPVCIRYSRRHFNPAWTWGSPKLHLARMMTQLYNKVTVSILPAHEPSAAEVAAPRVFAEAVRAAMARELGAELRAENILHHRAMAALGLDIDWRCSRLLDPRHEVDADGCADLQKGLRLYLESKEKG